jgi:hypothetical protein
MSVREKDLWCLVIAVLSMGGPMLWETRSEIVANFRGFGGDSVLRALGFR